jgi:hypothetical protein
MAISVIELGPDLHISVEPATDGNTRVTVTVPDPSYIGRVDYSVSYPVSPEVITELVAALEGGF